MTPQEIEVLKSTGELFVRTFAYNVPLTLFYGAYVILASLAMYCILSLRRTHSIWILFTLLIITLLVTTVYFGAYVSAAFILMQTTLVKNTELALQERLALAQSSIVNLQIVQLWFGGVNGLLYIFGDGIVVWRAYAVWSDRPKVIILPALMLLASFAIFLTSSSLRTVSTIRPDALRISSTVTGHLVAAGFSMSIATNLLSTVMIGIKAYQHIRLTKTVGADSVTVAKVLVFLTESGMVYVALQIIDMCLALLDDAPPNSAFNITSRVWGPMMDLFSAIYPTLVILIVHGRHLHRRSQTEESSSLPVFSESSFRTRITTYGGSSLHLDSQWQMAEKESGRLPKP
ncbi:hypothetical protein BT96DRAFT_1020418 [Gymnopus androsaceus JB14]|uniref:Integral membrane protein n=1 Tax=Gymnopus androsaceus JB14 TaxID=1447944 RepID=A0A6A4HKI8_9AGAR|nr:hypothetical protein BT96DRAFT_1020418 [Gymnopus androsaceus JB14]